MSLVKLDLIINICAKSDKKVLTTCVLLGAGMNVGGLSKDRLIAFAKYLFVFRSSSDELVLLFPVHYVDICLEPFMGSIHEEVYSPCELVMKSLNCGAVV